MLYGLILTLLVIDGLLLAAVVLFQAGQGGGLASLGGGTTDLVMGGRQAVTILHTLSWWTGGIFMFLALVLSLLASRSTVGVSEVQQRLRTNPAAQVAPAPLGEAPTTGATPAPATGAVPAPAPATTPPATK
ncbi:MAG: preprotein translocase subunit SecG [Gemmatimonadetes bacterium]|nr:preprotein translocase subunit SecG [Gemmatimonadota bacterium]